MPQIFGLDIGSTSIKAVELKKAGSGFSLVAVGMVSAPPKGMNSEAQKDLEEVAVAIKKLIAEAKFTTKYVNICLPESQVFTQILEMPSLSDSELTSAIQWEAEQVIPLPLADVSYDFQVLSRPEKAGPGEKMRVLLVAAPKSLIEKYLKVLTMAGLNAIYLESEILALSRTFANADSGLPTLLIHIGALTTNLAILRNNVMVLTRSLPTGGRALARAVVQTLGLEESQAEEYKKTYGLEEEKLEGKVMAAIKPIFDTVVSEMKRIISFDQEKNPETPLKRAILSGGTARLPGICTYLTQNLGLEVQIGNPWQNITKDARFTAELDENVAVFATAVGLAMKEV